MSDTSNDSVTALVIVRPAATESLHSGAPIQRSNLASVTPDEAEARHVAASFRELGFAVGPLVGVSMAITAPRAVFQSTFDVELERDGDDWTVGADAPDDRPSTEFPLDAVDASIAACVDKVVFEPPRELDEAPTWH